MDGAMKFTYSEIHDLALVYAQEKFAKYLAEKPGTDEECKELNVLVNLYRNAKAGIPSAEITEFT